MIILDLLESDGFSLKRVASTRGGEYAGACPFCMDGKDRFRVWPDQGEGGRWWCRQCGRSGDIIQYLKDYRRMSFVEAAKFVGKEISNFTSSFSGKRTTRNNWSPRETTSPVEPWQARAKRLVGNSEWWLFQPHPFAQKMLRWLKERRGLYEETIKKYRLGLVPTDRWESPEKWGLNPVLKGDGTPKKIWIPRGLAIPLCHSGQVLRVRIRRPKSDGDPRYYLLRSSDTRAMILGGDKPMSLLVESELDALLLYQEAGDLVNVISLGNAQTRPDQQAADLLNQSQLILLALDADEAGGAESWRWWKAHYLQAHRWPPVGGKDPGDMRFAGVSLRDWIIAGLDEFESQ